jgi:hypothetical protein
MECALKFYQPAIALTSLVFILGAAPSQADTLPDAMPCEIALETSASQRIFDLKIELGRTNALSRDEFSSIRSSFDALLANGSSVAAKKCFSQYTVQGQRYEAWFAQQAGAVSREAELRLSRTCGRQTDMFIRSHRNGIDKEVRRRRLAKAAELATNMQKGIMNDPMIRDCKGMEKRLGIILKYYIPGIQNQAARPQLLDNLGKAHDEARSTLEEAHKALQTSGRKMMLAPISLESKRGQDEFRSQLGQCKTYLKNLAEIGAPLATGVPSPLGSYTVQDVQEFCSQATDSLTSVAAEVIAHNAKHRSAELLRWRRTSLKTWGMEKVFNAKGRPIAESKSPGGAILWTYAGEAGQCLRITFTSAGKKVDEQAQSCPVLSSK